MKEFIQTQKESTLVSVETPLIANLDMCENIALIKEVHENLSVVDAETEAIEVLVAFGLGEVSRKRVAHLSKETLFWVMYIRAMMTKDECVMIELPGEILGSLFNIQRVITSMQKHESTKQIFILDVVSHQKYYEGCICHIEK